MGYILHVFTARRYAVAHHAVHAVVVSVCPSVRPSQAGILSKRLNAESPPQTSLPGRIAPFGRLICLSRPLGLAQETIHVVRRGRSPRRLLAKNRDARPIKSRFCHPVS